MLLHAHSAFRYLALLAGIAVILYALHGMATSRAHDRNMKNLALTFRSTMDISVIIGVVMIMTGYGFYNDLGVHILVMVLATVVSHLVPAVMRKRPQAERTLAPYAVATAISLAMVMVGTLSLNRPPTG
jgi:Na+-translocating ferredoxin:NAD+ oxidoreductase RnfE subunit